MATTRVVFLIKAISSISRSENASAQGLVIEEVEVGPSNRNFASALNNAMVRACLRAKQEFKHEDVQRGWEWVNVLSFQILPGTS